MARRLGVAAALIDGELVAGDVAVDDGAIEAIRLSPAGGGGVALPGFIDLQVNGFGGIDFIGATPDEYGSAAHSMAATGVTGFVVNLVSSDEATYQLALATAAAVQAKLRPRLLGVHLEGPFLAPAWAGAHDPTKLTLPDAGLADRLLGIGPVVMMTLAPELPGALPLIVHLVGRGVLVSVGHTDADAATTHAAFDSGARAITHIFNAHRRFSPRDPGPAAVALARDDVSVMAILDGHHLASDTAAMVLAAAGSRFAAVTDATAAAGLGPGSYTLGGHQVTVEDGSVRLADGTLAGSALSLDRAFRRLLQFGLPMQSASAAVSTRPARLLGRSGVLSPGEPADITVVDDAYAVTRTIVAGEEIFAA